MKGWKRYLPIPIIAVLGAIVFYKFNFDLTGSPFLEEKQADDAIAKIVAKMKEMCDTFPGNEEDCFMFKAVIDPEPTSDKIHALTRKFLSKLLTEDKKLRAIFTGTSNTASHGNYYEHSYPRALGRLLTDFFSEFDIEFESINTAIGSVGHFPRPLYCQPATYGENADILSYEFGMFGSNNCDKEQFMRTAIANQNNPVFITPNPGGPSHCANRYSWLYYNTENKGEFMSHLPMSCYEEYHPNEYYLTDQFLIGVNKSQADLDYLSQFQESEAERHGKHFNARPGTSNNVLSTAYGNFGYTNFDFGRGTGEDSRPFWLIRACVCRNAHHPGALGHYLMAHQIGYWLLDHLKEAVEMIKGKSQEELDQLRELAVEQTPMPEALNSECEIPGEKQTQCWMTMEPRLNTGLEEMITSPSNVQRTNFFGPSRDDPKGYKDVHEAITVTPDMEDVVIEFDVEEKMNKNHADGRVWVVICGHYHANAHYEVDGEYIDYENREISEGPWKILNYEITDERPQEQGSDGHANHAMCLALKPISVGHHTLTIRSADHDSFSFKMLFLC